jgi:hypothetical protein
MKTYRKYINVFLFGITTILAGCSNEKDVLVVEPVERIKALYMTGASTGWSSKALTKDPNQENVFTYEVALKWSDENKLFKFTREEGDWDKIRYLVPTAVDYNGYAKIIKDGGEYDMFMCSQTTNNLRDHFWGISAGADGTYRLTVNPSTLKLKVEKLK